MADFNPYHNLQSLDLGGTKSEGVILKSVQEPEMLFRHRVPTSATQGYAPILGQVAALARHFEDAAGYRAAQVGIGTPGTTVPKTGLLKTGTGKVLNGRADLEAFLLTQTASRAVSGTVYRAR